MEVKRLLSTYKASSAYVVVVFGAAFATQLARSVIG